MPGYRIEQLERRATAVVRSEAPLAQIGPAVAEGLSTVFAWLARAQILPAGWAFARYLEFGPDNVRLETGATVATPIRPDGGIEAGELPGGEAAVATHLGPYESIEQTYTALAAWVAQQGRSPAGPMWEVYVTRPDEVPDPAAWRTDIYQPLA